MSHTYSCVTYTRPNHFVYTSGCNVTQAKRCEPVFTIDQTHSHSLWRMGSGYWEKRGSGFELEMIRKTAVQYPHLLVFQCALTSLSLLFLMFSTLNTNKFSYWSQQSRTSCSRDAFPSVPLHLVRLKETIKSKEKVTKCARTYTVQTVTYKVLYSCYMYSPIMN